MGHAFQTAEKSRSRSPGRASSHALKQAGSASQDALRPKAGSCACGGGCPRCGDAAGARVEAHTARSLQGDEWRAAAKPGLQDRAGAPGPVDEQADGADWDIAGGFGSLVGPPQFTVTAATRTGPTFSSCRGFDWVEDWSTTGRSGFIVQEITNTGSITRCDGTSVTPPNTPHFWEAWPVDATGVVGDGGGDEWFRAPRPGTSGSWSLSGNVGFTAALDPAAGFSRTAVPDANGLLATTTDPNDLYMATLTRHKAGVWDCCNGNNFHNPA